MAGLRGADIGCPIDDTQAVDVAPDFPLLDDGTIDAHYSATCRFGHRLHVHVFREDDKQKLKVAWYPSAKEVPAHLQGGGDVTGPCRHRKAENEG